MRVRLLGPAEIQAEDGSPVAVPGAKRRAVLALLALELGRCVPVERFFELLWGEHPPAQAKAALQGHVAALRKVLAGSPFTLLTRAPGYLLLGEPARVDVHAFRALAARAAADPDDAAAAELFGRALELWHGAPLADLPETELRHAFADELERDRRVALEAWAERLLRTGRGATAVPALEPAVRADWLHEPAAALLVRCLHQAGRPADALNVYHRARAGLAEELGAVPGAQLRAAFTAVLAEEPAQAAAATAPDEVPPQAATAAPRRPGAAGPAAPAPRLECQLPRLLPGFVGRTRESRRLDELCGADHDGDGIAVVIGPAGVGKTATVVRWAHAAARGFPDGLLHADLRGFDPAGPTDPAEVLARFLRALGVPEGEVPEDPVERGARYRELTGQRQLLVVLDDVRAARDVSELLPAGAGCATVVTSRNTLEDLVVTEGAVLLRLEALPAEDALALLGQLLGDERVRAEPAAARRLSALCDQLPLALRIAAARLSSQPSWTIAGLVAELEDERTRLPALDAQGGVSVRSALNLTHRHLDPEGARLLALLAVHPGGEVDVAAAAALLGTGPAAARRALGSLASYHLLTESSPGRFHRHDLVRVYGLELLDALAPDTGRLARARLLDHYLAATGHAAARLQPHLTEFGSPVEHPTPARPVLADVRAALAWFTTEEPAVRSLVDAAAAAGEHRRAWQLAHLANCLYYGAGRLTDRLSCLRSGLAAAVALGEPVPIALLESATARALGRHRPAEALALARQAAGRTAAPGGAAHVHSLTVLSLTLADHGDLADAVLASEQALALLRELGVREAGACTLAHAAGLRARSGDGVTALRYAREAGGLLAGHPEATFHLHARSAEAEALHLLGRPEESEHVWRQALEGCRTSGIAHVHALTRRQFADFLLARARPAEAAEHLAAAAELYTALGDSTAAADLAERLATIRGELAAQPAPAIPLASRIGRSARTA
ncbi:AfsR/SARP family transcriptional regulator [Kitasatospora sp. NPDC094015]|uniref:AfsR/SARP family transcriptional regulator n=1 Tax=Kitasatospora sp. NPDC094015 TaxID=3155205 RepID=UPI003322BF83